LLPVDGQLHLRVELGLEDDVVDFFERQSAKSNAVPLNDFVACATANPTQAVPSASVRDNVFYVFFSKFKKHDFLRFFESSRAFSRRLLLPITIALGSSGNQVLIAQLKSL